MSSSFRIRTTDSIAPVVGTAADLEGHELQVQRSSHTALKGVAYTATWTPNPYLAEIQRMTLTGNTVVSVPTDYNHVGLRITLVFTQDGTGGRTVAFDSGYKVVNWSPDSAAGKTNSITFVFDGTDWLQTAHTVAGGVGGGSGNLDGGTPSSVYGGLDPVDGGVV